ncbi:hypothetical protein M011DRAFT_78021 [Sporormia fimetaria CBS 119925]|uniref:Uncharacterized protein n=1 Tax=Sporormia fimetaria CBS 119925 TaxID=1340428 RepID=A0A6A6VAI6_9PLEO|nr:hypothetical protein M011DRAFT_78021 [Sporormia fimetaria CBS 119925]
MTNKDRIYLAVYRRTDASTTSSNTTSSSALAPRSFQWGIWIEPKGSSGHGTTISVEDDLSVPFLMYSFDSHFHVETHSRLPSNMLGRLMIGKIPAGKDIRDVERVLKRVPLPSDPSAPNVNDTVDWTRVAVEELQKVGCAENFRVEKLMSDALGHANTWAAKSQSGGSGERVNYTWSRTFP